jgi:hypothetical protein
MPFITPTVTPVKEIAEVPGEGWYCYGEDGEKESGYVTTPDGELRYCDPLNNGKLAYTS